MAALDSLAELNNILEEWNAESYTEGLATTDPVPKLTRLAELLEHETAAYYKMDPDPFDDRHPGRANPTCTLGHLFKALFKNEEFMNKFVSEYLVDPHSNMALHTAAARLLYDVLPAIEKRDVFVETEGIVEQLLQWAETGEDPLRTYAVGLLASAMELQDVASNFKERNSALVPVMLKRLHHLQQEMHAELLANQSAKHAENKRNFAMFGSSSANRSPSHSFTSPSKGHGSSSPGHSFTSPSKTSVSKSPAQGKTDGEGCSVNTDVKMAEDGMVKTLFQSLEEQSEGAVDSSQTMVNRDNAIDNICTNAKLGDVNDCTTGKAATDHVIHSTNMDNPVAQSHDFDEEDEDSEGETTENITVEDRKARLKRALSPSFYSDDLYRLRKPKREHRDSFMASDMSNSSWAEIEPYVIGSFSLQPLSLGMKQRLILQYLTPMGEYQELISAAFKHRAMDLVFYYINLKYNQDVKLAFEALKYLAVLLCHKKFAIEFLQCGGVQKLLEVYRPSIAATGVSLCLYYLSYFEDAMERVCLLSDHVLTTLVNYILWLLECSHDSSRCHAAMFFTQAFPFLVILNRFDTHDGLRRLYNVISTMEILNIESSSTINEDHLFTMRQSARHVCVALKKYFESHLVLKVNELKRSHLRTEGGSPQHETPAYKAIKLTPELVQENIEVMMELMPMRQQWLPEATFHKLGGITLLSQLLAMAPEWNNYTGKPETIRAALDVISICCVTSKSQLTLLDSIPLPEDVNTPAISIFIGLAEGEVLLEPDVQKSALSVIVNCVCGPLERLGGAFGRFMGSGKKKINWKLGEDILAKMWNGVRENNGIMVLLKLLAVKTPITDADSIKALACKALVGLARSETVRQIISKLPLFNNGQLQMLMKEPVLQDKRQEHVKFCKYATELIERVSGKRSHSDATLEDIRKADIVAQSKITFHEKELLQLILGHLQNKGYHKSVEVLQKEADLPACSTPPPIHPPNPHVFVPVCPASSTIFSPVQAVNTTPKAQHRAINPAILTPGPSSAMQTSPSTGTPGVPGTSQTGSGSRIHFSINRMSQQCQTPPQSAGVLRSHPRSKYIKESDTTLFSPAMQKGCIPRTQVDYGISLDHIITEYLRKQHALCPNTVVTCAPMSLFTPHRCPEPRGRSCAPISFTARMMRKMIHPLYGGFDGCKLDRKFIYSRFKPVRTYKEQEDDGFCCCTFATTQDYLILGTYAGNLKLINTQTGEETGSFHCHSSPVTHCEHSWDGKLVLTSSSYGILNSSALWSWGSETLDNLYNFEDHHIEFSKHVQDRLVGTKDETANVYDISTGEKLLQLYDADKANNYKANRAVFNPTDDMVLNDGVLWDIRSGSAIHKFDKFNQFVSGVFHPVGLEIIINSEVWDLRSFRLLHTVPALDQCQIRFSHMGDVMYATRIDDESDMESEKYSPYGSTFRTFDATNYSLIATIDVKSRSISDLCTDKYDSFLAVVENQQSSEFGAEENICRLYEIGKVKNDDDQQNEEEEDATQDDDDDDDDEDEDDDEDDDDDLLFNLNEDGDDAEIENGESDDNEGNEEDEENESAADVEDDDDDIEVLSLGSEDVDMDDDDDDDADLANAVFELADF